VNCSSLLRRALALISFASVLGFGGTGARSETVSAITVPPRRGAVIVGSSSIAGSFGRLIAAELESKGYQVTRKGVVGAGLARPDYRDMREVIRSIPIDETTAAVFVYLGTNDGQAIWLSPDERMRPSERWLSWRDQRWPSVYLRRAQRLYEGICRRGAQRAVVLMPVEVVSPRLERRLKRIRALQEQAAQRTVCATAFSTTGRDRRFSVGGRPTRLADGFHMTKTGARLAWERVKQRALFSSVYRDRWVQ
jgi:hypothetical protein